MATYSAEEARRNNFFNPIGSLGSTQVYGTGGNLRHSGNFREDNPYLSQLNVAVNNKDKDALYAQAIEWEADYSNRQMQLAENKAILDEQRQYDLPTNQIARQRAAGINPDIAAGNGGSSVGSSSAQMANPEMADQNAQVQYKNAYADTAQVLEGINTVTNVFGTIGQLGGTIVSAYDALSTLPSRISLGESQAYIADKTKDIAVQQATETLRGSKLSNAAKIIDTAKSTMSLYGDMSQIFGEKEATDEELNDMFTSYGIPEEDRAQHIEGFRGYMRSPKAQAQYAQQVKEKNEVDAYNAVFTPNTLLEWNKLLLDSNISAQRFKMNLADFENSVVAYKSLYGLAKQEVISELGQLGVTAEAQKLAKIQLKDTIDSTMESITFIEKQAESYQKYIDDIKRRANEMKRPMTAIEKNQIRDLNLKISYLKTQAFNEKAEVLKLVQQAGANATFMEMNQREDGDFKRGTKFRNRQNQALETLQNGIFNNSMSNEEIGDNVFRYITGSFNTAANVLKGVGSVIPK